MRAAQLSLSRLVEAAGGRDDRIAEVVEAKTPLQRLDPQLVSAAYQDGVLVQIHINYWRGFRTLNPEDLGMQPSKATKDFLTEAVTLGGKRLLPADILSRLKSLEVMGRGALRTFSFDTLFGSFVPCTAYGLWLEKFQGMQQDFYGVRDRIIAEHDEIVEHIRQMWLDAAPSLWNMANKRSMPAGWDVETADRIAAQVRSKDDIHASFRFEQELRIVPIPSQVQVEALHEEQAARARRLGTERAALVEAFDRDLTAEFAGRKNQMTSFVDGIQAQVSEAICKFATETHNVLVGKPAILTSTAGKLRRLVEQTRAMNFMDDPAVNNWLQQIEGQLDSKEASVERLTAVLREVSASALTEVAAAKRSDASFKLVLPIKEGE